MDNGYEGLRVSPVRGKCMEPNYRDGEFVQYRRFNISKAVLEVGAVVVVIAVAGEPQSGLSVWALGRFGGWAIINGARNLVLRNDNKETHGDRFFKESDVWSVGVDVKKW